MIILKNSKKEGNVSCGCLIVLAIIVIVLIIGGANYEPTPEEIAQTKKIQKDNFIKFENELSNSTYSCDIKFQEAQNALKKDAFKAAEDFQKAHYICLDSMNNVKKIKIPDLISSSQTDLLKSALDDLSMGYALKYGASKKAYKFLSTGNTKAIFDANDKINIARDKIKSGKNKINQVKKELEISQ